MVGGGEQAFSKKSEPRFPAPTLVGVDAGKWP